SHTGHLLLIPIPPLFLLHTYFDHRDLHSFPTRRSSDLSSPGLRSGTPSEVPFRSRQEVVTGAMRDGERGVFESDIWRPALEKYAGVTHLTVALYDAIGRLVCGPINSTTSLFALFAQYQYD